MTRKILLNFRAALNFREIQKAKNHEIFKKIQIFSKIKIFENYSFKIGIICYFIFELFVILFVSKNVFLKNLILQGKISNFDFLDSLENSMLLKIRFFSSSFLIRNNPKNFSKFLIFGFLGIKSEMSQYRH